MTESKSSWSGGRVLTIILVVGALGFGTSGGGSHSVDNYLPAHSLCNNYRWHYGAEVRAIAQPLGPPRRSPLISS